MSSASDEGQIRMTIKRCACCGAEYDIDECPCWVKCRGGCGKCELHCVCREGSAIWERRKQAAKEADEVL